MPIMTIINMKYNKMLAMTSFLSERNVFSNNPESLTFRFSSLDFIEPAGAIILLSTIDRLKENDIPYNLESIDNLNRRAISYGENMGIFQKLGLSDAPSFHQGTNYIAPTKEILDKLYDSLDSQEKTIETYYDEISTSIVDKTLKGLKTEHTEPVKELFEFVVCEMIRNIFDHSQTDHFYYGSQLYPEPNTVEVGIADLGVGLLKTVPFDLEEIFSNQPDDEAAIRKAMEPGISAQSNHDSAPEDYKNSGFGLAVVRRIIKKSHGSFSIASGKKSLTYMHSGELIEDCDIKGTLIRMRINLNELSKVSLNEEVKAARDEATSKGYNNLPSSVSQKLRSQRKYH